MVRGESRPRPAPRRGPRDQRAATLAVVATGGGLVFGGDTNGRFRALDDETGEVLWEVNIGSPVTGPPITYAVDGRQFVAVSTGSAATVSVYTRLTPELRPSSGNTMFVFALPDPECESVAVRRTPRLSLRCRSLPASRARRSGPMSTHHFTADRRRPGHSRAMRSSMPCTRRDVTTR